MHNNTFESEWDNTLQILSSQNVSLNEFEYFINLGREYSKLYADASENPKVVMVGLSFPEEILRAMGIDYCYVCGGSFESTLVDDVAIPKDADDEARSILGILRNKNMNLCKKDVILIPLYNDSMKKLRELVSDLATVICYEVPADKNNPNLQKRYTYEIDRVVAELKEHFKRRLSLGKLKEQCELSKKATETFAKFEKVHEEHILSDAIFLYIANSYNWCKDKAEWSNHLNMLVDEIRKTSKVDSRTYPEVLIMGSPIYFPDYKIMFVIGEMQLRIHTILHPDIEHIKIAEKIESKSISVKQLALKYLESDISPAFTDNITMMELVEKVIKTNRIKGILVHILRGQIEYDYELRNLEKLLVNYKIPVNRIETVHSYQDVEQIRLRLEAFSEMFNL